MRQLGELLESLETRGIRLVYENNSFKAVVPNGEELDVDTMSALRYYKPMLKNYMLDIKGRQWISGRRLNNQ